MARAKKNKTVEALKAGVMDVFAEVYRDFKRAIPAQKDRFMVSVKIKFLEAKRSLFGKTMVILGPPAAGKTTLLRVLQNPDVTGSELQSYRKTEVDEIKSFRCKWKLRVIGEEQIEFRFKVRKTSDVGGESYVRENHWGEAIKEAGILVYVFDIKAFLDDKDEATSSNQRGFRLAASQFTKAEDKLCLDARRQQVRSLLRPIDLCRVRE